MPKYGTKISKPNINVLTASDADLIFSSEFNTPKVFAKGSLTLTTDGSGNGTVSVAHNLGFAPAFKAFVKSGTTYYPDPSTVNRNFGTNFFKLHAYTDSTNLYFQAYGAAASTTYYLKYYIFVDLAQLYSGSTLPPSDDYGVKISQEGEEVTEAELYELAYSSEFPALKFNDNIVGSFTLSRPAINCTDVPNYQSISGAISHSLGYPPFFLCAFKTDNSQVYPSSNQDRHTLPWSQHGTYNADIWTLEARCTASQVIFNWYREAQCVTFITPCDGGCVNWNAETITIYYYIFREDLSLL